MEKLTEAISRFLQLQIDAGADAVQIFDSLGGLLAANNFAPASAEWMKQIIASLKGRAPVIVFSKGVRNWNELIDTRARVLGIDHSVHLAQVRKRLPAQ